MAYAESESETNRPASLLIDVRMFGPKDAGFQKTLLGWQIEKAWRTGKVAVAGLLFDSLIGNGHR